MFEITRTIYSNSERSEQFLVTECLGFRNMQEKLENIFFFLFFLGGSPTYRRGEQPGGSGNRGRFDGILHVSRVGHFGGARHS